MIDRTEAMTVVDVNTGKFTGTGGNLEETVTKNNLEAAEEIVRQLRLRDIGGIIVIDFIDMVLESNRDLVLRRLIECLGRDRTKHQVAEVTSLGLVQMTRKRVGQGLLEAFSEPCDHCNGRGVIVHLDPVDEKRRSGGRGGGNGSARRPAATAPAASTAGGRAAPAAARPGPLAAAAAKDEHERERRRPATPATDAAAGDDEPAEAAAHRAAAATADAATAASPARTARPTTPPSSPAAGATTDAGPPRRGGRRGAASDAATGRDRSPRPQPSRPTQDEPRGDRRRSTPRKPAVAAGRRRPSDAGADDRWPPVATRRGAAGQPAAGRSARRPGRPGLAPGVRGPAERAGGPPSGTLVGLHRHRAGADGCRRDRRAQPVQHPAHRSGLRAGTQS